MMPMVIRDDHSGNPRHGDRLGRWRIALIAAGIAILAAVVIGCLVGIWLVEETVNQTMGLSDGTTSIQHVAVYVVYLAGVGVVVAFMVWCLFLVALLFIKKPLVACTAVAIGPVLGLVACGLLTIVGATMPTSGIVSVCALGIFATLVLTALCWSPE